MSLTRGLPLFRNKGCWRPAWELQQGLAKLVYFGRIKCALNKQANSFSLIACIMKINGGSLSLFTSWPLLQLFERTNRESWTLIALAFALAFSWHASNFGQREEKWEKRRLVVALQANKTFFPPLAFRSAFIACMPLSSVHDWREEKRLKSEKKEIFFWRSITHAQGKVSRLLLHLELTKSCSFQTVNLNWNGLTEQADPRRLSKCVSTGKWLWHFTWFRGLCSLHIFPFLFVGQFWSRVTARMGKGTHPRHRQG